MTCTHTHTHTHARARARTVSNVCISSVMWCHEIWCIVSSFVEELRVPPSSVLQMVVLGSYAALVLIHWTVLCHILEEHNLYVYISEQLKSQRFHICKDGSYLLCSNVLQGWSWAQINMELQLHISHLDPSTAHLTASFQLTKAVLTIDFKAK
jgi:hypothetical protein